VLEVGENVNGLQPGDPVACGDAGNAKSGAVRVGLIGADSFARGTIISALAKLKEAQIRVVSAVTGDHARGASSCDGQDG